MTTGELREALAQRFPGADARMWSRLTGVREALESLGDRLRVLHDEDGQELFDVVDGVIADPAVAAPVRLLRGLVVEPWDRWSQRHRAAVAAEARRWPRWARPERSGTVTFKPS